MVGWDEFTFEVFVHDACGIVAIVWYLAYDHVIESCAECVDVCLRADVHFATDLFGADVVWGAEGASFFCFCGFFVGHGAC